MSICLNEIKSSQKTSLRPNFIVLLGDRYGWRPLPTRINADEFEALIENAFDEDQGLLLWGDEKPEMENGWYLKDDNATCSGRKLSSVCNPV